MFVKGLHIRVRQLRAMLRKNWLFSVRSWKTTLLQLLAPLLFVLLLLGIDALPKTGDFNPYNPFTQILNQPVFGIGKVPKCKPFATPTCVTIRYAIASTSPEDTANLLTVMEYIRQGMSATRTEHTPNNDLDTDDLEQVSSASEIEEIAEQHPNTTLLGLAFGSLSGNHYSYTIFFNASYNSLDLVDIRRKPDGRNELQISVDKALMRLRVNRPVNITVSSKQFPQLGYSLGGLDAAAQYGTVFFYCGIMFQFVILLYNICMEKDLSLRRGLRMIGLKDSVYWFSWYISASIICILATLVLIAAGFMVQFQFFTNTAVSVTFVLFLVYSLAIIALATFVSVFIEKAKSSLNAGMGIFVLGLLFVAIVGNTYTVQALYDDELVPRAVPISFSFVPPFNLAKAMADINIAYSTQDPSGAPKNVTRYTWDSLYAQQCIYKTEGTETVCKEIPSTYQSLLLLLFNCFIFVFLTWFFDNILPSSNGEPRPLWFFLQPSYWGITISRSSSNETQQADELPSRGKYGINSTDIDSEPHHSPLLDDSGTASKEDPDVQGERFAALGPHSRYPLMTQNLTRQFYTYSLSSLLRCRAATTHTAVDHLCLVGEESQVLALLGHNGAGKTTAINMLTGMLSTTEGDSFVYGFSVKHDMDKVRDIMGVCPQHDILWDDLTAREHMEIFCDLRCLPRDQIDTIIRERLQDVQLFDVQHSAVGTFSGGMKRRLSVALSFIGNPQIVYLDEPTTGMDPYIRRDIWNLILRLKVGRVIVMTTHSMEEADVLGDKIAVMALGTLRCVGSSIHLKNRFAGYKMNLVVPVNHSDQVRDLVAKDLPEATTTRDNIVDEVVYLNYALPPSVTSRLAPFFEKLEAHKDLISDFSISQTTLEEVFVNVTQESEYMASLRVGQQAT